MGSYAKGTDALAWHRRSYDVPARRGMRIKVDGRAATITGASGPHLAVRFDDDWIVSAATKRRHRRAACHPTWRVDYLDGRGPRCS